MSEQHNLDAAWNRAIREALQQATKGSFTAWSWATQKGWCAGANHYHSYDYHIFLSHSTADAALARDIATRLAEGPYRIFYAPLSFPASGVEGDSSGGWSKPLEQAILSSIHFVFITSPSYDNSPWCELEYLAFLKLKAANEQRNLLRFDISGAEELRTDYSAAKIVAHSCEEVVEKSRQLLSGCALDVGQIISPDTCLGKLPLDELSYPQGCTWDEAGIGNQYEPPYGVFQYAVREAMLLIRKNGSVDESVLRKHSSTLRSWKWDLVMNVIFAAKTLLEAGVKPEG